MKKYFLQISLLCCITFFCCDSVNVFDAQAPVLEPHSNTKDENILCRARITGGLNNIDETVTVQNDGAAKVEGHDKYLEKRSLFKEEELSRIRSTFKKNNFMSLESQKETETNWGVNSVRYEITFNDGLYQKTIPANSNALDNSMQPFIEEIYRITNLIIHDGLSFEFTVDKSVVPTGENVTMTFSITNTGTQPIDLLLHSTQTHDIYLKRLEFTATDANVWNWANTRAFENTNNYRTLGGEAISSFVYVWNCRDNQGTRLQGHFSLCAELLSWPGGITKPIVISVE